MEVDTDKSDSEKSSSGDDMALKDGSVSTETPEHNTNWDAKTEKTILRKCDLHILPWTFAFWLFAFIDRSNIENALLSGLNRTVDLRGDRFSIALTVFHVSYILVNVPSNWLLKYIGGGRYLPALVVGWAIVTVCMGTITNYGGLIACRLLLGAFEGGCFGGVILYLSMFYKRYELMFRVGLFSSSAALSGAFGGLLGSGLSTLEFGGYDHWPWIFFVEGAITIPFALAAFFFLPNTPSSASFLTPEEQKVAAQRLYLDSQGSTTVQKVEQERFGWSAVRIAVFNINTILMTLEAFLILIPLYSFAIFLPTIIRGIGIRNTYHAQLLAVPPNFLAFLTILATAFISDYIKMRGPIIFACILVAAVGYIILLASTRIPVLYTGTFFIAAGIYPCPSLMFAWLSNNLAPHYSRATGLGLMAMISQCGAIVATFTYLPSDAPKYTIGNSMNLGVIGLTLILLAITMVYIRWENRARRSGKRDYRFEEVRQGHELGYRHPDFRYTL